jgi:hypothetical protein
MSPRRNWDSRNPSLVSECAPSPRTGGEGHTRLLVRGWGSPNSDDLRKSLALCLLCASSKANISCNFHCRAKFQLANIVLAHNVISLTRLVVTFK